MSAGKEISPRCVEMIKRMVEKGNTIRYISMSLGVHRTTIYKYINMSPEVYKNYKNRRNEKQKKMERKHHPRISYKDALPPELWNSARIFLFVVAKYRKLPGAEVNMMAVRDAWTEEMRRAGQ